MKTTSNDGEGPEGLHSPSFRLNPEALRGHPRLPDLDKVEVVYVQHVPTRTRWMEGLMIHMVGSGLVASVSFVMGLMIGGMFGG